MHGMSDCQHGGQVSIAVRVEVETFDSDELHGDHGKECLERRTSQRRWVDMNLRDYARTRLY